MFEAMIDPTASPAETTRATPLAERPATLGGARIGLLANVKHNAEDLLDVIGHLLEQREGGTGLVRRKKLNITDPVPADILHELTEQCDVVVVGVGDCGSCSASAIADGLALEAAGVPAIVICTEAFAASADAMADLQGSPGYHYLRIPHPLALLDDEGIGERAEQVLPGVVAALTGVPATSTAA